MSSYKLLYIMLLASIYNARAQGQVYTKVNYDNLTVTFNGILQDSRAATNNPDTLNNKIFTEQTGYKLMPDTIEVESAGLYILKIQERIETSVTVMNEGPHCDLIDWKHYTSERKDLPLIKKNEYLGLRYNKAELSQFPLVTKDELAKEVKSHCGNDWTALLDKFKSINTEPFNVGVSKVFITINAKDKITGKLICKEITINVPMGD